MLSSDTRSFAQVIRTQSIRDSMAGRGLFNPRRAPIGGGRHGQVGGGVNLAQGTNDRSRMDGKSVLYRGAGMVVEGDRGGTTQCMTEIRI